MLMEKIRRNLNHRVKEWGNEKRPRLIKSLPIEYGLGNLLTTEVNFRKAGVAVGAVLPSILWCASMPEGATLATQIIEFVGVNLAVVPPLAGGFMGYTVGVYLDVLTGNLKEVTEGLKEEQLKYNK